MTSIYDWSGDADKNATIDDTILWNEGQPPDTVNDSFRAMMTRIKQYVHATNSILLANTTHGKNTTRYRVNVEMELSDYRDGLRFIIKTQEANTGETSLSINALPDKKIFDQTSMGIEPIKDKLLVDGGIYTIIYAQELDDGKGGWMVLSIPRRKNETNIIPAGTITPYAGIDQPSGWLLCHGQECKRDQYKDLFSIIGTIWGKGDNATTFNVPDLRGRFLRGASATIKVGTKSDDQLATHGHSISLNHGGGHSHSYSILDTRWWTVDHTFIWTRNYIKHLYTKQSYTSTDGAHTHDVSIARAGGNETRPKNYSIHFLIKV